jgi:hypothetical protein
MVQQEGKGISYLEKATIKYRAQIGAIILPVEATGDIHGM